MKNLKWMDEDFGEKKFGELVIMMILFMHDLIAQVLA